MAGDRLALDDITGFVVIREETPWRVDRETGLPIRGSQPPNVVVERFRRDGTLVERRVVPPAVRLVWDEPSAPWWRRWRKRRR
jgi:hypothetical protein